MDGLRDGWADLLHEGKVKERLFDFLKSPLFSFLWGQMSSFNFDLQRGLNPQSNEDRYPDCVTLRCDRAFLDELFISWEFDMGNPLQYHHKGQILSGHTVYTNGRQFHVRCYDRGEGLFGLKGHTEWNGEVHLLRHLAAFEVDYQQGCRRLRKLVRITARVMKKPPMKDGVYDFR